LCKHLAQFLLLQHGQARARGTQSHVSDIGIETMVSWARMHWLRWDLSWQLNYQVT